jgi:hypothetical protein
MPSKSIGLSVHGVICSHNQQSGIVKDNETLKRRIYGGGKNYKSTMDRSLFCTSHSIPGKRLQLLRATPERRSLKSPNRIRGEGAQRYIATRSRGCILSDA